ncbi:acyl-CoA dehydrogenase [Baekduia soli]|uniref:Medium-chain specific acyl-CoA dehydrogenase, mitochondrial n=1 Tax=Baekduia soli TaxID=496014 RepID=A0A5B8UC73_9ACTN|nr:acyl-CoA dehydrogenase [Baekduia soli]
MPEGTWELPHELQLLGQTVADFVRKEILPEEAKLDTEAYKLPPDVLARVQADAKAAGLWCVQTPEEHGGAGLSLLAQCVVAEEAAKCRMGAYVPAGAAFGWDPPNVIFKGTQDQIDRYANPDVLGEKTYVAISEPNGGADPGRSIQSTAKRDGDHYILNGQKTWITGGDASRWGVVFARTGGPGRKGISCFVVEPEWEGVTVETIPVIRPLSPVEMFFDNVKVPVENLLGEEGRGFELAESWLVHGRVPYAAGTIGVAQAALQMAIDYSKERSTFGKRLAQRQAIQWMLADSDIELRAARLLTYQAAWKADAGKNYKLEASIAKVYATETAGRVVDRAMQVLGGMGVAKELPLERWYREMRIKRIGEGPSEIHRMVIARELLGAAAKD